MGHDDIIKWNFFSTYWPCVRGIHQSLVVLPPKGQWYGAFMFSLIFAWTNSWANNWDTGDFRCHLSHYDVSVMDSHVEMCTVKTNYWALWKYCEIPNHIMLLVSLPSPWVDHLGGFSTAFDTKVYIGFSIIGQFTGLHGSRPFLVINQVVFEPIQLYIYMTMLQNLWKQIQQMSYQRLSRYLKKSRWNSYNFIMWNGKN